jgi:hypothetical protein
MLSRADYGELWKGSGYPPRPALPALAGSVVHRSLELLLTAFQAGGCTSVTEPGAVETIRELGGYSKLVKRTIVGELEALEHNPRAVECIAALRAQLGKEVPHIRERVQMAISRTRLEASSGDGVATGSAVAVGPGLTPGSHTEVELRVDELRLMGRADLICVNARGCTITDYKTGAPNEHHAEQVRLYALLWSRDGEVNPDEIPIEKLIVSYATHDEVLDPPTDAELGTLAARISARIGEAEREFGLRPPPANPAPELCRFCSVRHLCDDYWMTVGSTLATDAPSPSGRFVDCEAEIARQNGSRSWVLRLEREPHEALLRTPTENPGFSVGDYVRLLGVIAGTVEADETSETVLTMTQFSESFLLDRA